MEQAATPQEALKQAITALESQAAMSRLCGVSQPSVFKWVKRGKALPPQHVLKVEAATGISRHDLRPDIYPRDEAATSPAFVAAPGDFGAASGDGVGGLATPSHAAPATPPAPLDAAADPLAGLAA